MDTPNYPSMGEEIAVNAQAGGASLNIPIRLTAGRNGFQPTLSLNQDGGNLKSPYGMGWNLGIPNISRKLKNGLPSYQDYNEQDIFLLNSSELVPQFQLTDGLPARYSYQIDGHEVFPYYQRNEGDFARIERWVNLTNQETHWKITTSDNITSVYGISPQSRIADPVVTNKVFQWMIERSYDDRGNIIQYQYKQENSDNVDATHPAESNRLNEARCFNVRYLKRILYGNTIPYQPTNDPLADNQFLFEVVLDYGEHGEDIPTHDEGTSWSLRPDPYSIYVPGFELRTYRRCQRIVMFHHFEELQPENSEVPPTLVGATQLRYETDAMHSILAGVSYTGYQITSDGQIHTKAIPEVTFLYSQPALGNLYSLDLENVSNGLNTQYRWFDLYGEGMSGLLAERENAWYYKRNFGDGNFGPLEIVAEKPAPGQYQLADIDQNGSPNLAIYGNQLAGYYELDQQSEQWESFVPFNKVPHVDFASAAVQLIDVNGDGFPDILISEPQGITWYPSLKKQGFGEPQRLSKSATNTTSPPLIGSNLQQGIFLADITGDGLEDVVQIHNGSIVFWPNLGYGHFGSLVRMDNAPWFDYSEHFDIGRVRLFDINSSGFTDIIYLGQDGIKVWQNESGNAWSDGITIAQMPPIHDLATISVVDVLGDGTACLVWSDMLPHSGQPTLRYMPLTDGKPAFLLTEVDNHMGKRVKLEYQYSAQFYRNDELAGQPWLTKLPSHFLVVSQMTTVDEIGGTSLSTRYVYHDGYYDGEEREFKGFGFTEQFDTETFDQLSGLDRQDYIAPSVTKSWFHNGAMRSTRERNSINYYQQDTLAQHLRESWIENTTELNAKELKDAYRALAGQLIRQEVYGHDSTPFTEHPYTVQEANYQVRTVQQEHGNHRAAFLLTPLEQLSYQYERQSEDPRMTHSLTLNVDKWGNVTQSCQIAYPRRPNSDRQPEQNTVKALMTTAHFADAVDEINVYRHSLPTEKKGLELVHLSAQTQLFTVKEIASIVNTDLQQPLAFHEEIGPPNSPKLRLIQWERLFYWTDDLSAVATFRQYGSRALLHHTESAVFTPELISNLFQSRVDAAILTNQHYHLKEGYWWQSGAISHYKTTNEQGQAQPNPFTQVLREADLAGGSITISYDAYWLLPTETKDTLGNLVTTAYDYRTMAPAQVIDINGNTVESFYDPLGNALINSHFGDQTNESDQVVAVGDQPIADWFYPDSPDLATILQQPEAFLQRATTFTWYDLTAWEQRQEPLCMVSIAREQHVSNAGGDPGPLQIMITYLDGFGRTLQTKQLVEPGPVILRGANGQLQLDAKGNPQTSQSADNRWRVSGHIVYNNKQLPIKQYEPFFSTLVRFEQETELQRFGETPTLFYDPLGREQRVETARGFHAKAERTAWEERNYDKNDTVADSHFVKTRIDTGLEQDSDVLDAINKAKDHHDTPTTTWLDPLDQPFLSQEVDGQGNLLTTRSALRITGEPTQVIDPRGLTAFEYRYDMQGRLLFERSVDAGELWLLPDALDRPTMRWDSRNIKTINEYDALHRPVEVHVEGGPDGLGQRTEKLIYGEALTDPVAAKNRNQRGQVIEHLDQAGKHTFLRFDFQGQVLEKQRQLRTEYKKEVNWNDNSAEGLESDIFTGHYEYDALGRVTKEHKADGSTHRYNYHLSGGLAQLQVSTADGALHQQTFLSDTVYNAKGQLKQQQLGNGIATHYEYDPWNFRLVHLQSRRLSDQRVWQDLRYTYDAVGNITRLRDRSEIFGAPLPTDLQLQDYTYDARYQITQASGLCHGALEADDSQRNQASNADSWMKGTRHLSLNNLQLLQRYTRTYTYDAGGNLRRTQHRFVDSGTGWTREQLVSDQSNRAVALPKSDSPSNPESFIAQHYDVVGNITSMPHLAQIDWNYRNNIAQAVIVQRPNAIDDAEYYTYGSDGMRVRKVYEQLVNGSQIRITEKLYLDGCEILRVRQGNTLRKERVTTHVSTGETQIALIHRWTQDSGSGANDLTGQTRVHYQLSDHLGSATVQLNDQGDLISAEGYAPYGGSVWIAGDKLREIDTKDYRYSGKERDDHIGLYYYGFRYYASWLGRWTSPDPIGAQDGLNLYRFVRGNPIKYEDQLGLIKDDKIDVEKLKQTGTISFGGLYFAVYDHPDFENKLYRSIDEYEGRTRPGEEGITISISPYLTQEEFLEEYGDKLLEWSKNKNAKGNSSDQEVSKDESEEKVKSSNSGVKGDSQEIPKTNEENVGSNKSALGQYTDELDQANKEFGKLAGSQDSTGIAVAGGITSAFVDIGIGLFRTADLLGDSAGFWGSIIGEGLGVVDKETTDKYAKRLDDRIDKTKEVVEVVSKDPIGLGKKIHEQAVDSTARAMMGDPKATYEVSKVASGSILSLLGINKAKGVADVVEEGASAATQAAVKSAKSPRLRERMRNKISEKLDKDYWKRESDDIELGDKIALKKLEDSAQLHVIGLSPKNVKRERSVLHHPREFRQTFTNNRGEGIAYLNIKSQGIRSSTGIAKAQFGPGVYAWKAKAPNWQWNPNNPERHFIDFEAPPGTLVEKLTTPDGSWYRLLPESGNPKDKLPVKIINSNIPDEAIEASKLWRRYVSPTGSEQPLSDEAAEYIHRNYGSYLF